MTDLTPDFVRDCFAEEARKLSADLDDVIGRSRKPSAVAARRRAIRRIAIETGAPVCRIAKAWGADNATVADCLTERADIAPYDQRTLDRLTWVYGAERARAIVSGEDPATNVDIAAWRALGGSAR